jgi:ribosomal protein S18 acetylase RimI-like enzyme
MSLLTSSAPELVALSPELIEPLAEFFRELRGAGYGQWFHPHPLTDEEAESRCRYQGQDFYGVMHIPGRIMAYGMLRGWDEGFAVPSLGIAVHPAQRRNRLGRTMLEWLHCAARFRRADQVRLTVCRDNRAAIALYESAGYAFSELDDNRLLGTIQLTEAEMKGTSEWE